MIDFTLAMRKDDMITALDTLLRIESIKSESQRHMPYGKGVFDALMETLSIADRMGFDSVNFFSHMGYVDYGDSDDVFGILTHLDVVPAGEGWTVPPFEATVKDGRIYGRGALDNKGPAIATLFALNAIQENCITLRKRVRLIFGCDEESGWSDIEFYKNQGAKIPDLAITPDANFPIINVEKGLLQLELSRAEYDAGSKGGIEITSLKGGDRVNVVPDYCDCMLQGKTEALIDLVDLFNETVEVPIQVEQLSDGVRLYAQGQSAHGSEPQDGKNAVSYMLSFLNQLPLKKNYISDAVFQLGQYIGLETTGKQLGIDIADHSGNLTLNLGYIKTHNQAIKIGLDIRYPVTADPESIKENITNKLSNFIIEEKFSLDAHSVAEDSKLIKGLKKAYKEVTDEDAYCLTTGGATYARAFPNAVAFGPLFPNDENTAHQPDEYIKIDTLIQLADIIANAIVTLCK